MTEHNPHAQSLAYLNDQGKVTGYEMPNAQHVSQNPSDLQGIAEAQVVTTNKPSFLVQEEAANELISGPPKKYIDGGVVESGTDSQQQQVSFSHASDNKTVVISENQSTTDDIFADIDNNYDNNNDNNNINVVQNDDVVAVNNDDPFAAIGGDSGDATLVQDEKEQDDIIEDKPVEDRDEKDDKQTFLSVWQEQHREAIAKRVKDEREAQDEQVVKAKQRLEEFNEDRRKRMEAKRKEAQSMESDLREDYDAVFKHGTIWQQVVRLVDLKSKKKNIERMRDLLIILKNKDDKQSK